MCDTKMVLVRNNIDKSVTIKGPKSGISLHDWAQSGSWRSRPSTKASGRITVGIFSPRSDMGLKPDLSFRRCQTMIERPSHYKPATGKGKSYTLDYIQYLERRNKESEAKLKNTMNVLSMQRSKSDLDHREGSRMGDFGLYGDGLNRERSQIYMTNSTDFSQRESGAPQANKQEMRMGMAVVPRKGLIHLSTNDEDTRLPTDDFSLHGDKRRQLAAQEHPVSNKPKGLIKRKDIMEHYRAGNKLLEESEAQKLEEEEMSKSLGNYTILDLQSKLLEMTDAKVTKRGALMSDQEVLPSSPGKRKEGPPKDKPITLPAIKNINPFTMK